MILKHGNHVRSVNNRSVCDTGSLRPRDAAILASVGSVFGVSGGLRTVFRRLRSCCASAARPCTQGFFSTMGDAPKVPSKEAEAPRDKRQQALFEESRSFSTAQKRWPHLNTGGIHERIDELWPPELKMR